MNHPYWKCLFLLVVYPKVVVCMDWDYVMEEVNLTAIPHFITKGSTFRIQAGETLVLPCEVHNLGSYILLWKKGKMVLTAGKLMVTRDRRFRLGPQYSLNLRRIRPQDAGDYVCQIGTLGEPKEMTHTVEILVPPTIRRMPLDGKISVAKGSTATLECKGSGNPVPTITWTRKNNLLPSGETSLERLSITLEDVDRHQAGVYLCTASNGVGAKITEEINLKVYYPPEIEVERSWIHSGEGYEAELVCIVYAEPPPNILWYKDTLLLDATNRRLMAHRGNRHTLSLLNVNPSDFGNYSCVADNNFGRARKYVEVSGRPTQPEVRSPSQGRHTDKYNITWSTESYSPVVQYRLVFRKSESNRTLRNSDDWTRVSIPAATEESSQHVISFVIDNLEPGSEYEVSVSAKNKYGWSRNSNMFTFKTSNLASEVQDLGMTSSVPAHAALLLLLAMDLYILMYLS